MIQFRNIIFFSLSSFFNLVFLSEAQAQDSITVVPKSRVVAGFDESMACWKEVRPSLGNDEVELFSSSQSLLYLGYNHSINRRFEVEIDGGIAIQTSRFTFANLTPHVFPNPQLHVRLIGTYDFWQKTGMRLSVLAGGGFNHSFGEQFSTSSTIEDYGPNGIISSSSSYAGGTFQRNQAFTTIGLRFSKGLKNQDELQFSLKGTLGFAPIIQGTYSLNDDTSTGSFAVKSPQIQLGVAYHFTRQGFASAKKVSNSAEMTNRKDQQRARAEKRAYDPKSWFIELAGGYFWMLTQEVGDADVFESTYLNRGQWQVSAEKGIGKNMYLEVAFHHESYAVYARKNDSKYSTFLSKTGSNGVSLGIGKRLISSTNFNWLNLEAGLSIHRTTREKGTLSESVGTAQYTPTNDTLWSYNSQTYLNRSTFSTVYLGANKEFQLTKRFYLTLAYQFNLGFSNFLYSSIQYTEQNQPEINTQLQVKGTAHSARIGMKLRI